VLRTISFAGVADDWDLGAAVAEAVPGNLFPSGVGFNAARADAAQYVRAIRANARRGIDVRSVEIVRVPKGDRSTRPAADVPATDQHIYQAIATRLKDQLYPGLVTFTGEGTEAGFADFEQFPLTVANVSYVLAADAASFYEYVDHDRWHMNSLVQPLM